MNSDPIDLIGAVTAIIALFATQQVAEIVSPYIAIIMAASIASIWTLTRGKERTVKESLAFVGLRVMTAIIFSVAIARLGNHFFSWAVPSETLTPIAAIIGFMKSYDEIKSYLFGVVDRIIGRSPNV